MPDDRPILTPQEAAELLAVPVGTLKNLHRVGVLRGTVIGKHLRFLRTTVDTYIQKLVEEASR